MPPQLLDLRLDHGLVAVHAAAGLTAESLVRGLEHHYRELAFDRKQAAIASLASHDPQCKSQQKRLAEEDSARKPPRTADKRKREANFRLLERLKAEWSQPSEQWQQPE